MTYRCVDCVFSEVNDKQFCDMTCLKHRKTVKCMNNHCDDLILRPFQFVSHLVYASNMVKGDPSKFSWSDADYMAKDILDKYAFAGMKTPEKLYLFENTSGQTEINQRGEE